MTNVLEHDTALIVELFEDTFTKSNQNKYRLFVSGHKYETTWEKTGETNIWESNKQNLMVLYLTDIWISMNIFLIYEKKSWEKNKKVLGRLSNFVKLY